MQDLLGAIELAIKQEADTFAHLNWRLKRIYGGMNGIVYRAEDIESADCPMAIKIRKRDERQRAEREFSVLQALKSLPQPVASLPVSLHTDLPTLPGDVVISSWVEGRVLGDLSAAPLDLWERILLTLSTCHALRPDHGFPLRDAVLPIRSASDVIDEIERRYARLPDIRLGELTKSYIREFFDVFKNDRRSIPPAQHIGLIVCDTNPSNMIENGEHVLIIDWENAGWADPAFDIADLLVRPNCAGLSHQAKTRIIGRYTEIMGNPTLAERIVVYERLMLIFWLILTSQGFVGNDAGRLAGVRQFTQTETIQQQLAYIQRIEAARSS